MRKCSAFFLLFVSLALSIAVSGCASVNEPEQRETRLFTDSCGRTVEIPVDVRTVVPSGPSAQLYLYTLCPEKLQSLATPLTRTQKQYFDESCWDLPVTGQFYGGSTLNYEELIAASPDLLIDIGDAKTMINDDMDALQERTGIPVVFIEADLSNMAEAYEILGDLLGVPEQGNRCAEYIREHLEAAEKAAALIPEDERVRVLYSQGEYGTEVLGRGSVHAEVLEAAGAVNVAELSSVASKGGNEVSMDQILLWDPDVILLSTDANYEDIFTDPSWSGVRAVSEGRVYEVPLGPCNWLDRPPAVQRVLAVSWLENLLYPDLFEWDAVEETQEFYSLFWHYDISEDEVLELLSNSTCVLTSQQAG